MNGRNITAQQMRELAACLVGPVNRPCTATVFGGRREVRIFVDGANLEIFRMSRSQLLLQARYKGLI